MDRPPSRVTDNQLMDLDRRCHRTKRRSKRCCASCNSQICCSYILAMISTGLVVVGVYLSILHWNHWWMIISAAGLALIFIGSCMYYCGVQALYQYDDDEDSQEDYRRHRRRQKRRGFRPDRGHPDELVPSAPSSSSDNGSQLSLNMIPQYFSRGENTSTLASQSSTQASSTTIPYKSQIFNVNGHSFLILPLSNENAAAALSSTDGLVVKIPTDNKDNEMRKNDFAEFLNSKSHEAARASKVLQSLNIHSALTADGNRIANQCEQGASSTSNYLSKQQQHQRLVRQHSEDVNLVVLPSSAASAITANNGNQKPETSRVPSARHSLHERANEPPVICSSVNATSYFVSFTPASGPSANNEPHHHQNQNLSASAVGAQPIPSKRGVNNESNHNQIRMNAASVRSSLQRQGTFKQNKPTVIQSALPQMSASNSQSSTNTPSTSRSNNNEQDVSRDSASGSSRNQSSAVLIDVETSSVATQQTNLNSGGSDSDPTSSFHDELYHDEGDIDTNEEFTPPPSYAEVLEDQTQFVPSTSRGTTTRTAPKPDANGTL